MEWLEDISLTKHFSDEAAQFNKRCLLKTMTPPPWISSTASEGTHKTAE